MADGKIKSATPSATATATATAPTTVYCVGTRTTGTGGFEWRWKREDADAYFKQEMKDAEKFRAKGERYEVFRFEHTTTLSDADEITAEIDEQLGEYEDAAGILEQNTYAALTSGPGPFSCPYCGREYDDTQDPDDAELRRRVLSRQPCFTDGSDSACPGNYSAK